MHSRDSIMRSQVVKLLVICLLFAASGSVTAAIGDIDSLGTPPDKGYDEVHNSDGSVRDIYVDIYKAWQQKYSVRNTEMLKEGRHYFQKDNTIDALPRLISAEEFDKTIRAGVDQRLRAILAFLDDHYSGRRSYAAKGVLPAEVVKRIIARNGESGYDGLIDPKLISFIFGPDLIRDADGTWRVVEDNVGFVGGVGDLIHAQNYALKLYPEIEQMYEYGKPFDFYKKIADECHAQAARHGGKAVVYMIPSFASDNEDKRIAKIFKELGLEVVTPDPKASRQLVFNKDGVYLRAKSDPTGRLEKVGYVFMDAEHADVDPTHPASWQKHIIDGASSLLKSADVNKKIRDKVATLLNNPDPVTNLPDLNALASLVEAEKSRFGKDLARKNSGFVEAILKGKVGSNYSPGVDFVGDKEFYSYVPELIEFYLYEKPLLKNIPTLRFESATIEKQIEKIFSALPRYVIKQYDGRGGDSVWIGKKLTSEMEIRELKERIRRNPTLFMAQAYSPLSTVNDNIVDMRVLSSAMGGKRFIADTGWGRGIPMSANGKVNLSLNGREFAVMVIKSKVPASHPQCQVLFTKASTK